MKRKATHPLVLHRRWEEGQGGGENAEGKLTRVAKTRQGGGIEPMRGDGGQRHRTDVWHHMGWGGVEAEREKVGGDRER